MTNLLTPIAPILILLGAGHPLIEVEASLGSAIAGRLRLSEIICIADADSLKQLGGLAADFAMVSVIPAEQVDLNLIIQKCEASWILLLDGSARLADNAMRTIETTCARLGSDLADASIIYGDTRFDDGGEILRPTFSPLRIRSQNYLGPLLGITAKALRSIALIGPFAHGVEIWDIALRFCEPTADRPGGVADTALRIPEVLSLQTQTPVTAQRFVGASLTAVRAHLERMGVSNFVSVRANGDIEPRYPLSNEPLVSIVIPTKGSSAIIRGAESVLVIDAIRSILEKSTYGHFEIVVVADDTTAQPVIDALVRLAGDRLRLVRFSEQFNFSAKMNRGAAHAAGSFLLMLNDDVEVISPDWIETMLGLVSQPGIGMVGSLLYFEDGTVQHAGHRYAGGWAGHIAAKWEPGRSDLLGSLSIDREVSGVTAACSMISAALFWQIGGFSLAFAGNYNDVDLSFKVRSTGARIICTGRATLFHFESKSRVATVLPTELAAIRSRWGSRMLSDPYWRD